MLFYEQKDWEEDFRNPPAVFRLHMMCHDLADPEAEDPCSRVLSRAKDGVTGYVTNISWKNAGEYLKNPEAWKRLNDAVSACVKAGARVWLYDENGFPSGTAGGLPGQKGWKSGFSGVTVMIFCRGYAICSGGRTSARG